MHVMALFKLWGGESPSRAALFFPCSSSTHRFQIQAGQLLIEDVTWFLPRLVDAS